MNWQFDHLYLNKLWSSNVTIQTDGSGVIQNISLNSREKADHHVRGWTTPGFYNCHSHAFQYAFLGRTEYLDGRNSHDDFWTWRTKMYKLANSISPEEFEAIATLIYAKMLKAGYTWVTEFQYLHHDQNGKAFEDLGEMSQRLLNAAKNVGIGITLAPTFYQMGGFGKPAREEQRRFIAKNADEFLRLRESCAAKIKAEAQSAGQKLATAFHSLRAVQADDIKKVLAALPKDEPIHIHIAEQIKEVEDCLEHLKARPVEWLLGNLNVNENWFLVHATHTNNDELSNLAKSKGQAVLCPSTEGNLGDGVFSLVEFKNAGGHWCIGTDSQISVNPMEDLRWLEYSQRLKHQRRNALCSEPGSDSGELHFNEALDTGRKAQGLSGPEFSIGENLDFISFYEDSELFHSCPASRRLSTVIFGLNGEAVDSVVTRGQWRVSEGKWQTLTPHLKKSESQLKNFFSNY